MVPAGTLARYYEAGVRSTHAATRAGEWEQEMQQLSHRIFLSGGLQVDVGVAARRREGRDATDPRWVRHPAEH